MASRINLLRETVTLTDAQIKALPSTPQTLVIAQGANKVIVLLQAFARSDFSAGAYTNVDATSSYLYVALQGEQVWSSAIENRSSVPVDWLSQFLGASDQSVQFTPYQDADPVIGVIPFVPNPFSGTSVNVPLQLIASNNGAGNWTGGNAANTLRLDVFYTVVNS